MPHPTCSTPRPVPPLVLDQLVRQVAEAHAAATHATLVRIRPGATGVEVGLCSLPEGVHPVDALVGHVVPPVWAASGIVAPAHARSLDDRDDGGTPTVVAMLVGRDGHTVSHVTGVDALSDTSERPVGRIPDLLRRTLGLPTDPPPASAAEWWRACWLDAVVTAAAEDPTRIPDVDRPLTSALPLDLVQALVDEPELCADEGWGRIRAIAALPDPPGETGPAAVRRTVAPHVDPTTAAWMDDGCFARWLLGALPAVDELLDLAEALVPAEVLAQLRDATRPAEVHR